MVRRTLFQGTPKHNILTKNHSQRHIIRDLAYYTKLPQNHKHRSLFVRTSVLFNSLAILMFAVTASAATFQLPVLDKPPVEQSVKQAVAYAPKKVSQKKEQPPTPAPAPPPAPTPAPAPPPPEPPAPAALAAAIVSAPGTSYPWANAPFNVDSSDTWGMYKRQCTSYAAWKVASSGRHMPNWGGHGNANLWDDNARAEGIPVDATPRVGDIAVRNSGTYGHVMYVESVNGDGTIGVSQYNADNAGSYSEATVSVAGLVFIHF
ncbi:MAG: hypothetical protein JWO35_114 [Candidatus Saccharibacteria bacterium]|nr:hypothetical protein [Candidatus Saccharibacteria bacterium]